MTSSLKLEAGKSYRGTDGNVHGPLQIWNTDQFIAKRGDGIVWRSDGSLRYDNPGHAPLLVEEVREPKYDFVDPAPADPVNRPNHYTQGAVECIDAIKAAMSGDEFRGFLRGNVIKYLWRYKLKGGSESLAKAQWYLARLQAEIA